MSDSPTDTASLSARPEENAGPPHLARGQMRFGWRVALGLVWILAIGILSSVWQLSVQIGHHTVWLGPAGEPRPWIIQVLPFFGPLVMLTVITLNSRHIVAAGIVVSIGLTILGVVDLGYYQRLGVLEIVAGVICMLATIAAAAGRVTTSPTSPT